MKSRKNPYNEQTIYDRIEKARNHAGYVSNEKLAAASNGKLKPATLSRWTKGTIPRVEQLLTVCNLCDCDIDYLLGRIDTFHEENHTIHEETLLAESEIELLREERNNAQNLLGVQIPSTKTKLIGLFIRECNSIADELDQISLFSYLPDSLNMYGIDSKTVSDIYLSIRADDRLQEHDMWCAFRDQFLQQYPQLDDDNYIMNLYMALHAAHSGNLEASRFAINQEFNRIIDLYIEKG